LHALKRDLRYAHEGTIRARHLEARMVPSHRPMASDAEDRRQVRRWSQRDLAYRTQLGVAAGESLLASAGSTHAAAGNSPHPIDASAASTSRARVQTRTGDPTPPKVAAGAGEALEVERGDLVSHEGHSALPDLAMPRTSSAEAALPRVSVLAPHRRPELRGNTPVSRCPASMAGFRGRGRRDHRGRSRRRGSRSAWLQLLARASVPRT
jgi:hypothetical protein